MSRLVALASLSLAWAVLVAATPLPLAPPPPDLTPLVPFVSAPLDKPPLKLPALTLSPPPVEMPTIPAAAPARPVAEKPTATMPPRRTLPCVGAWTGQAGEALECGRAQILRGDFADALQNFDRAIRNADDPAIATEARYWMAETHYRLGRIDQADTQFRRVVQDRSQALSSFALHGAGWTALVLGDAARAHEAFSQLLASTHPMAVDAWARHGLGLALSALGRHAEAERTWGDLLARRPGAALERDALFWHGDALGRVGQPDRAAEELSRFTQGPPHPLLSAGLVRLAWWSLVARRPTDAVAALRAYPGPRVTEPRPEPGKPPPPVLARPGQEAADRDWVDATRAQALLATDDWDGARAAGQALESRRSPLALPVQVRVAAGALARRDVPAVEATLAELMRGTLAPPVRAWVLAVKGEAARAEGKGDDARTQYDLARGIDAGTDVGRYATLRVGQINLEMREFAQAVTDLAPLVAGAPGDPPFRVTVLLLQGEAAYRAGDFKTATAAFGRALTELPDRPETRAARLGLAWTALREGKTAEAGRGFAEYARLHPDDEQAIDALVLASEMALGGGDLKTARELLDRILARHASAPRAEFSRLNRAVFMLRGGEAAASVPLFRDWVSRAPFPPLMGRARIAHGVALLAAGRPGDARGEFSAARREGEGALAALGLGTAALAEDRLAEAARDFTEARNEGTAPVAAAAEYGLTAVAFRQKDPAGFKSAAAALVDTAPRASSVPPLLYALTGLSADAKDWRAALATARRLVTEFPEDARADDALERVGAAAAAERAWPVAYEAYTLLREKYPKSPFVEDSRVSFAEAQVETGRAADGRKALEQYFASGAPTDARSARARITLARAREMAGDHAGALDAYTQAARAVPPAQWMKETQLAYARLLTQARRYDEAKGLLLPLIKTEPAPVAADGALVLGEALQGQGDEAGAVEYFMTAAYVAPDTTAGQRGLLAAGRAFAAQKQPEAAATVYRKLLAQSNVPADLAASARRALAELSR